MHSIPSPLLLSAKSKGTGAKCRLRAICQKQLCSSQLSRVTRCTLVSIVSPSSSLAHAYIFNPVSFWHTISPPSKQVRISILMHRCLHLQLHSCKTLSRKRHPKVMLVKQPDHETSLPSRMIVLATLVQRYDGNRAGSNTSHTLLSLSMFFQLETRYVDRFRSSVLHAPSIVFSVKLCHGKTSQY